MRMCKLLLLALLLALTIVMTSGCQTMRRLNKAVHDGVFGEKPTTRQADAARDRAFGEARKTADPADGDTDAAKKEKGPAKTLYERLGGEAAIVAVVDDLVAQAAANPAVNFTRKGAPRQWQATPQNVALLKKRLVQFLGTATGGPQRYEGEDMRTAHRGMAISAAEFDAFVKDVKASLDQAKVPQKEQKELLEIIESTRGPIVEQPATR